MNNSLIKVVVNSILSLIAPTPRECCEAAGVPEFCLGLCSPVDATARQENRINACSKYDSVIDKCFQSAEGKNQVDQLSMIFYKNITLIYNRIREEVVNF